MVLFEAPQSTVNGEERVPQKEEKNLIANINLDGKEKQERKNQTTKPKESSSPSPELHNNGSDEMGFLICLEPPRIPPKIQRSDIRPFQHLCVLATLSLQNKPPCDILHPTGKLCWGQKSWQSVLGQGKSPAVPSCWDTITGHHWDQGVSAFPLNSPLESEDVHF